MRKQELHPRTAIINKKQKNHSKKSRLDALSWLANKFPKAFDNSALIQPLKLGIMDDILAYADEAAAAGISKSKLREAVVIFTRRIDYLATLKAREMRIDLQGNPVIAVTEEEAERAAVKIKKRVEKRAKNARKTFQEKSSMPMQTKPVQQHNSYPGGEDTSYYMDRAPHFNAHAGTSSSSKPATVVVKHKPSRAYDPNAVARLKEKLGISKKAETVE